MWQQGCCHSVIISVKFTKITLESLMNLKFLFACHLLMGWVNGGVAGDTPARRGSPQRSAGEGETSPS